MGKKSKVLNPSRKAGKVMHPWLFRHQENGKERDWKVGPGFAAWAVLSMQRGYVCPACSIKQGMVVMHPTAEAVEQFRQKDGTDGIVIALNEWTPKRDRQLLRVAEQQIATNSVLGSLTAAMQAQMVDGIPPEMAAEFDKMKADAETYGVPLDNEDGSARPYNDILADLKKKRAN